MTPGSPPLPAWPRDATPPVAVTRSAWQLDFEATPRLVGRELFVGEWSCNGAHAAGSNEVMRYVELGLQREGTHVRTIGRDRRVVDATLATLNAAGDELRLASRGPQRSTAILLRGELAAELVPRLPARFIRISPAAARLHARMLSADDAVALEETALALLHRVASDAASDAAPAPAPTPARRRLADDIRHVIATRFTEPLTVEDIAAACGASAFYACRVFRAVTGETLHRHLTRVRLLAALFELRRSAGRLTDLALAVGFSSHSHFTYAFRTEFGCAPTAAG